MGDDKKEKLRLLLTVASATGFIYLTYRYWLKLHQSEKKYFTDKNQRMSLPLIKKTVLNHNTRIFRFGLPEGKTTGLPVGQHLRIHANVNGKDIFRHYTPISTNKDEGFVDVLIKVYHPNSQHPEGGQLSQYMDKLALNEKLEISAPHGRIEYLDDGDFKINPLIKNKRPDLFKGIENVCLIAVGTGITPMWQMLEAILSNSTDKKKIYLVYGNRHEEDILLRKQIEEKVLDFPDRLAVFFTLSQPSASWKGFSGRINQDLLAKVLPSAGQNTLTFTCGLPVMNKQTKEFLINLGHSNDHIYQF